MPFFRTPSGVDLYYERHEPVSGNPQAETIIFSHGLLWSGRMFADQVRALQPTYRVLTYDHRGQGQSSVPDGPYDMDTVYDDAVALIEGLQLGPCHFAGLSMGGFVGMRLAARRPDLIRSLLLLETTADPEPDENKSKYRTLNAIVRWLGVWPVVKPVMQIMFSQSFLTNPAREADRKIWEGELRNNKRSIVRAVNGVINRNGVRDELDRITVPTLIVVGEEDIATKPEKARRIHEKIAGSTLIYVPRAGHSSSVEEPEAVNQAIRSFLDTLPAKRPM